MLVGRIVSVLCPNSLIYTKAKEIDTNQGHQSRDGGFGAAKLDGGNPVGKWNLGILNTSIQKRDSMNDHGSRQHSKKARNLAVARW